MNNTFNRHIIWNEIKAKECYPYVPFDERRMSVGADLGRSSNVIPTSKRPPVRICGGLSDIQRMFWMSECDIWVWVFLSRTSVGLPCVMWEEAGLESEFWKRPQAHWVIDDETAGNLSFVSFSSPVYFRTYISYNWHIFKNLATFFFCKVAWWAPESVALSICSQLPIG